MTTHEQSNISEETAGKLAAFWSSFETINKKGN